MQLLRSMTAVRSVAAVQRCLGARPVPMIAAPLLSQPRMRSLAVRAKGGAPPAPEPIEEADLEDYEEYDPMEGLSAATQRRVLALKEVQEQYDNSNRAYQRELAQLQAKYLETYAPLFAARKDIVTGKKEVGTYDIPDDGEQDEKSIPEFWLTAMYNHEKISAFITERDAEVLKHLVDIRMEVLTGEDRGFKLFFDFEDNKYLASKTLEKTYVLEPEDDIIPRNFIGSKPEWKDASLDPTVEMRKKRVKSKDGAKGAKPSFTNESVPCESFFNFFDPPTIPEKPDELGDEEMEALQEELSMDFDIGFAIKENLIPRAVEWFTGEIAPIGDQDFEGMDEYEDEEEEEPEPARGGKGGRR